MINFSLFMEIKIPKRSSLGIGKAIGGSVYLHRDYVDYLPNDIQEIYKKVDIPNEWNIIKYDKKSGNVSLILSPDFDDVPEPHVASGTVIKPDGTTKFIKGSTDPWIYHHKWLFVDDDYQGFDVDESKERSRVWMSLDDIDYSRIGKKSFWEREVLPRLEV